MFQEFLLAYNGELTEWLYTTLTRLLSKLGTEHSLSSLLTRVQKTLDVIRQCFALGLQFNVLTRFVVDSTQSPNMKVRQALLNYLHSLAMNMDAGDFVNSSDTRLAISRIITWSTEPKSVDVRKSAQAVLISLFNLNTPEFSMLLSALPKTFQDGATRILHNHVRTYSQDAEPLSPHNVLTPSPRKNSASTRIPAQLFRKDSTDTENMNPEDIYNSIKQTSADIQNQWLMGVDDLHKEHRETTSQDSGIQVCTSFSSFSS